MVELATSDKKIDGRVQLKTNKKKFKATDGMLK